MCGELGAAGAFFNGAEAGAAAREGDAVKCGERADGAEAAIGLLV